MRRTVPGSTRIARAASWLCMGLLAIGFGACAHRHAPPDQLPERYRETPGLHSERPGPHSTTVGRHGTAGTVGGGIDAQSGSAGVNDEAVDQRYHEEGGWGWQEEEANQPPSER